MAAAIPMIVTFAQGAAAAGSLAAGVGAVVGTMAGSLGGFLTMAGGMMAGLGTLTGDKSLTKFGSILTLTGGIGSLAAPSVFGASGSAAGAGGEAAQSASEAASASSVTEPVAQSVAPQAGIGKVAELNPLGQTHVAGLTPDPTNASLFERLGLTGGDQTMATLANQSASVAPGGGIMDKALAGQSVVSTNPLDPTMGGTTIAGYQMPTDPLAAGARSMTMKDVAAFLKENKELVSLGGNMLASMYGPQAEALDFQKSLYERRRRNLNNPVRLGIVPGG